MPNVLQKTYTIGKLKLKGWHIAAAAAVGIGAGLYMRSRTPKASAALDATGLVNTSDPAFGEAGGTPNIGDVESVPYAYSSDYGNSASAVDPNADAGATVDYGPSETGFPVTPVTSVTQVLVPPIIAGIPGSGGTIRVATPGQLPAGYHWVKYPNMAAPNAHPGPARSEPGADVTPHACPSGFHWNGFTCVPNR